MKIEKVTQKYVQEYKRIAKNTWHDQAWWDFMNTLKAGAVDYAVANLPKCEQSYREIAEEANNFLLATKVN